MILEEINNNIIDIAILVKSALYDCPDKLELGHFPFSMLNKIMEKLGWRLDDGAGIDTNGWEVDYWIEYTHPKYDFKYSVSGSLFYGGLKIEKERLL